ncbi:MAG: hypothetical protein JO340_16150 [Acidobacteriaceae bacterium]|nr:hypothetical protein [Acidobacteriaceae bacterium]
MPVPTKEVTITGSTKTYRIGQLTAIQGRDLVSLSHHRDFNLYVIARAMNNACPDGDPYTAEGLRNELSITASVELFIESLDFSGMPVSERLREMIAQHNALAHAGGLVAGLKN